MADSSVRPATLDDVPQIARIQAAVWAEVYRDVLPADTLAAAGSEQAAQTWRGAVAEPPSPRHRVLAALAGDRVVGFAALGPAGDPDLVPQQDAELHALCVDPEHAGAGHGSRLVNASADVSRGAGFGHLHVWLSPAERGLRTFLEQAGWAADGATRSLDLRGDGEVLVEQVRLRTMLAEPA
jgi:ribosomal protein S18 acetylase RimI-like enzyme